MYEFNIIMTDRASAVKVFSDKELWRTPLTNFQLDALAKQLKIPHYRGTISRDELPKYKKQPRENFIINIQHSERGGGTHWVSVIKDGDKVFYFDSYGAPPVKEVLARYKGTQIVSSTFVLQNFNDVYCGIISMYVLWDYWHNGMDFYNTTLQMRKIYGV